MKHIKAIVPWWLKIGAKIVLSRLPFGYAVWQRLGLFRHGEMDNSEYAIRIFCSHVEKSNMKQQLAGKTVLELGPGDSIASAIIATGYGAKTILVDTGRYVRKDIAPYFDLEKILIEKNLTPTDLSNCMDIEEILTRCNARYLTNGIESLRQVETGSVDLIFSQAVLEHVRKHAFQETMRELRRILKFDGVCSHRIDLRDHLGGALNNLRFDERIWESKLFSESGFYTNRIQYERMLELFNQAGFDVEVTDVRRWDALPTPKDRLAKEFNLIPEKELCISGFDVLLR